MSKVNSRLRSLIEKNFGKDPRGGYSYYDATDRMALVKRYHTAIGNEQQKSEQQENGQQEQETVDDITWGDLEMDQVFLRINHTNSFIGEQVLYHKLHVPDTKQQLEQTEARIESFEKDPEFRIETEARLGRIAKMDAGYYLSEFLLNSKAWQVGQTWLYHLLQLLLIGSFIVGIFTGSIPALAVCLLTGALNLFIYLSVKQRYEIYFNSVTEFVKVYGFVSWLEKRDKSGRFVSEEMKGALKRLQKLSWILFWLNDKRQGGMTGDIIAMVREYLWGILLVDVSLFNHTMRIISNKQEDVKKILFFAGQIDADIAVLSFRKSLPVWCRPEIAQNSIRVTNMVHPLIQKAVANSFELDGKAIITGSNASGKSTFMKSIAINGILARTIHTCTAEAVAYPPVAITTCMALRDDVLTGESYYFREAKYLKRMLDLVKEEKPVLVIVDEILKGTNTSERIAASKAILEFIGKRRCLALIATHDYELTENEIYKNYHFSSDIVEDDIVFDYKIKEGKSRQSNAITLLAHLGYPEEIVQNAKNYIREDWRNQ